MPIKEIKRQRRKEKRKGRREKREDFRGIKGVVLNDNICNLTLKTARQKLHMTVVSYCILRRTILGRDLGAT